MRYLDRIAVAVGLFVAAAQLPTTHPSILLFWGGILVAAGGVTHAVDTAETS